MPDADPPAALAPERSTVRWGLGDAAAGWVAAQVGGLLAITLVLALSGREADELDQLPLGWIAVAQLGLWLGLLGAPVLASRLKGNGLVRDFGLRMLPGDVPLGLAWGLALQFGLVLIYIPLYLLTDIDANDLNEPARAFTDRATDPLGVVLLVLIVGIGAPIIEEIFYRGLLQRSLIRRFGRWPGIIGTGLIFGASHFEPLQFPALACFGVAVGYLAVRYDRLGPGIVAHIVFNMAAVVSLISSR
ncbi:MAG TPA: CPBP family intramembrane glutamic endopeptidase [Acidimicrobiales bacterium]